MHIGSFTMEGTFAAAAAKLEHIAQLGFTQVQLVVNHIVGLDHHYRYD